MALEEHVERVRTLLIKKMSGKAYLRPQGLIDDLATDLTESSLTIRQCMGRLAKEGWLGGVAPDGSPFRQVKIIGHIPAVLPNPDMQRWHSVMDRKGIPQQERKVLSPLSAKLSAFSDSEQECVLSGLLQLRANLQHEEGRHRFLVSANYLVGSSKLLSALDSRALRAFGIDVDRFPSRPIYIVVGGNTQSPRSVVLVENPISFETAVVSEAAQSCLFVCTFGFGLSASTNDYGNQLAGVVESGNAHVLNRSTGPSPRLNEILNHPDIQFWGDLDTAGMQIFCRLAAKLPNIKLSALYSPMLEAIKREGMRHPYVDAVGKEGQSSMVVKTSRHDVQSLLVLCQKFAVDQEFVTSEEVARLAGQWLQVTA
jgi:hypothetical protein